MGEREREGERFWWWKPEGRRPQGYRHRWQDNFKMDLREIK
jgi:hypothetical protein